MARDRSGPPLILPPGVRSPLALAVAGATAELIKPPTYPKLQRIAGQPHAFPEGRGMLLQLFIQTSPIAGRCLALGVPFDCKLPALASLLRDTAAKLDEILAAALDDGDMTVILPPEALAELTAIRDAVIALPGAVADEAADRLIE